MVNESHEREPLLTQRPASAGSFGDSSSPPEDSTRFSESDVESAVAVGIGEPDSEVSAVATVPADDQPKRNTQLVTLSRASAIQVAAVLAIGWLH